jgi:hypothetical protein
MIAGLVLGLLLYAFYSYHIGNTSSSNALGKVTASISLPSMNSEVSRKLDYTSNSTSAEINIPTCSSDISRHVTNLLITPEALSIPYGRAYVAKQYGVALYAYRLNDIPSDNQQLPSKIEVNDSVVHIEIRTCKLPLSVPSVVRGNESQVCDISLYARMVRYALHNLYNCEVKRKNTLISYL